MLKRFTIYTFIVVILVGWILTISSHQSLSNEIEKLSNTNQPDKLGFFTPHGIESSRSYSDFSVIPVYAIGKKNKIVPNLRFLKNAFKMIEDTDHKITLNITSLIAKRKVSGQIDMNYIYNDKKHRKKFEPLTQHKVFTLISNKELKNRFSPLTELLKKYQKHIDNIIIFDEPYINSVSKNDLERVANYLKEFLSQKKLNHIQLQVNFASAMFNSVFAHHIDEQLVKYVYNIDQHYVQNQHLLKKENQEAKNFQSWIEDIKDSRLVSYDQAGNIYKMGGIPKGVDVVSFDFYAASVLLDEMYNKVVSHYCQRDLSEACRKLNGSSIKSIRKDLSFFADGPVSARIKNDRKILDDLFKCRMESTLKLLKRELKDSDPKEVMMVAEASSNGFFEFDSEGHVEQDQPNKLVELRVLSEFKRYLRFYNSHRGVYNGGILIFLYPNTYDASIKLKVFGVEGMPSVKNYIKKLMTEKCVN